MKFERFSNHVVINDRWYINIQLISFYYNDNRLYIYYNNDRYLEYHDVTKTEFKQFLDIIKQINGDINEEL
jgi:hypothetical protein